MNSSSDFERWVVPVTDSDGAIKGTGWLVSPHAVVTCEHVLVEAGYSNGDTGAVLVAGYVVEDVETDGPRDLAVLRVTPVDPSAAVEDEEGLMPLTRLSRRGSEIFSHGFDTKYRIAEFPSGAPMTVGKLTGPPVHLSQDDRPQDFYVIDQVVVHGGLSGAPAWDSEIGAVMGVMAKADGLNRAYVIPIDDLLARWPEFERPDPGRTESGLIGAGSVLPSDDVRPPVGLPPRRPTIGLHTDVRLVGRDDALADLTWRLAQGSDVTVSNDAKAHAVYGLGGIGKTALVLEFCHRHQERFSLIWWVNAESATTVSASYRELALRLRLPFADDEDARVKVSGHLHARNDWLAVFDNVESQQELSSYRPQTPAGQVIATSRNPHNWGSAIQLEPIEDDPAVDWLLTAAGHPTDPAEHDAAAQIAGRLNGLALALAMATSYIRETRCSLAEYLQVSSEELPLGEAADVPADYGKSVYTAWNVSTEQLERTNPHARILLDYLAFCAPDRIPIRVFTSASLNPENEDAAEAGDINRAIRGLLEYALISRDAGYLYIHRLVQQVTRHQLEHAE